MQCVRSNSRLPLVQCLWPAFDTVDCYVKMRVKIIFFDNSCMCARPRSDILCYVLHRARLFVFVLYQFQLLVRITISNVLFRDAFNRRVRVYVCGVLSLFRSLCLWPAHLADTYRFSWDRYVWFKAPFHARNIYFGSSAIPSSLCSEHYVFLH